jgi:AbiV family abortive infection protein
LLGSAAILWEYGDISTSLVVGTFAREEFGRSRILQDLAEEIDSGQIVTRDQVTRRCANHLQKQAASLVSVAIELDRNVTEQDAAHAIEQWAGTAPGRHHSQRMLAQYVDLADDGRAWLLPRDQDRGAAQAFLRHIAGDYRVFRDNLLGPVPESVRARFETGDTKFRALAHIFRLLSARESMQPVPVLPKAPRFSP